MISTFSPIQRVSAVTIGLLLALIPVLGAHGSLVALASAQTAHSHDSHAHGAARGHTAKAKKKPSKSKRRKTVGGTIVLGGALSADSTLTMAGAFSVGRATSLEWDLPLATSVKLDGYEETVTPPTFAWNIAPDAASDITVDGNSVRQFEWIHPPVNTVITVTETLHVTTATDLVPFQDSGRYPLQPVPPEVAPYLAITPDVRLPAAAASLVSSLAAGQTTERAVVTHLANWVATHIRYSKGTGTVPIDAASIYRSRSATCEGYDNIMAGMLRQLHIPVRTVFGWVSAAPVRLPGPKGGSSRIGWSVPGTSGELHTWLDVYFPTAGWAPFDPQAEKFFVDPRHVAFFTNIDAGAVVALNGDTWYGAASGAAASASALTGAPLPDGAVDEVPGDGPGSHVTIRGKDTNQATFKRLVKDHTSVVMFSR